MTLEFGTDGVRGLANAELTPELVLALGRAAARVIGGTQWLVGRDTRRSGLLLQNALSAGLASEGVEVIDLGVLPTPGVAFHAAASRIPAAMISASHNSFEDNGVKLFAPGGRKLSDAVEERVEAALAALLSGGLMEERPSGAAIGMCRRAPAPVDDYATSLVAALGDRSLEGLSVVLDCANGAAWEAAPRAFVAAGATVTVLHASPNGVNINADCGSTYPQSLQATVKELGADLGLAFDGDADRLIAVDQNGELVDGDQVIALCANDLAARGELRGGTVVVTVMTNLGFRMAMEAAGIKVYETKVGDRYVLEALEENGWSLGGEQSGHVVFRDIATTGDGLLTGLLLCDVVKRSGSTLGELATASMTRVPQLLENVRVSDRDALEDACDVWDAVARARAELGDSGRVLLRPSGTEPLVRVMVEALDASMAQRITADLVAVVRSSLT